MASVMTTLDETPARTSPILRWRMAGVKTTLIYGVLVLLSLFFLFPLAWMVGTSLKTITEITQPQLYLLPAVPQWHNYGDLLLQEPFIRAYFNSIFITTMVLFGTVTSISLVAFAFSR